MLLKEKDKNHLEYFLTRQFWAGSEHKNEVAEIAIMRLPKNIEQRANNEYAEFFSTKYYLIRKDLDWPWWPSGLEHVCMHVMEGSAL